MKYFTWKGGVFWIFSLLIFASACAGDDRETKIGIIFGQWQPNLLRNEKPISVFKGTANSTPYFAINIDHKIFGDINGHFSVGYWAHRFEEPHQNMTVAILPVEFGIEHELIKESFITPYVLYGAGFLLGREKKEDEFKKISLTNFSKTGFGLFLLTGFRITPYHFIDFDLNFGYCYAKFPIQIGVGEDYSGVRASLGINYLF